MAIFYKVDPSHVKKLAGDFGKVFEKICEGQCEEDIERWTQALVEVATIAGYDSSNWDNEAAMIENIATEVSNKLIKSVPSSDFDGLVGMNAHMENINLFLSLESNEVKMIGIWGPSGIGKSTIARALFSRHSHQFQHSVFMENIKRRYQKIHGYDEYSVQLQLQEDFLSQILHQKDIKIDHLGVAQDRLKDKRVFVVLDDVDHSMQLDAVAKELRWFGPGSRIIITTQDKKLLTAHGTNHIYEVNFPREDEALEIFCMYAFGQKYPFDGSEKLAREVMKLAGKLPVGLRVMGSYLKGMAKQEWKKELPRLQASLDGEIESILEFSYNALRAEDKELFLYIACIFKNKHSEKVEAYLANHFSDVSQGLHILAEKSLISLSDSGNIEVHDLLARFGKNIDRKQSSQFLVDARDIRKVLKNNATSRGSVIGAFINFSEIKDDLIKCDNVVESMSCLQFLRVNNSVTDWEYFLMTCLPSQFNPYRTLKLILKNLPQEVRLLDWEYFPMTSLPSKFNPKFLVELNMQRSKLRELWSGSKTIKNLKWVDLSFSENLRRLPDLSTATNLQELNLRFCESLKKLPSSIGNAINLQRLDLEYCYNLIELPSSIGSAINLHSLNLEYCYNLRELPSSIGDVTSLRKLLISGCSKLVSLPQLPASLETLDAERCQLLEKLHCSFHTTRFVELNFANCFKLNQEARDLIIKASTCKYAILPGEKVPLQFTYRAFGSSCSMKLNGTDTHLPTSLTFQACFLLAKKGDVVDDDSTNITVVITEKRNGISVACKYDKKRSYLFFYRRVEKHLFTYELEGEVSSSGLVFEFETDSKEFLIAECGISILS